MAKKVEILYEDEAIVIVNKPAGVLSIPDRYKPELANLQTQLQRLYDNIWVLHRIDKDTSGVLCFAKTAEAHKVLSHQFEHRLVQKKYLALLDGRVLKEEDRIEKSIGKHPTKGGIMVISNKGKEAITDYKIVEKFKNFTLVEADIKTGRTHQIRVHFHAIGFPLAIDDKYGRREHLLLSQIKRKGFNLAKNTEERPLMNRLSLHAASLTITHPSSKEELTIHAPLPKDFNAILKQLRKWGCL